METENLQTNYQLNAIDLQNLQNQNNIQESSTWIEWGYWYFTHGKIIRDVYQLSKVVSPQQTIRQIATYTVGPLTKKIDEVTGWGDANIKLLGYKIPCSFSTLGTLATETLAITTSPAQWVASKTVNLISNSFTSKVITELNLKNQGALGREAAVAIQIGSSLICQKTLEEVEKNEIVASTYEKVDNKLKNISKPIDKFVYKQISNGLEKLGIDTTQPLGLTKTDIEREKNLLASEAKVANAEEKIQELKRQENKLQEQVTQQDKIVDQNHLNADTIIQKAREYEKSCPDKNSIPKYKKHRKYNKVWAKNISEQFVSEFNISEQQRSDIQDEIVRKLSNRHGKKEHNKAMKEVIVKHKAVFHNKLNRQLDDVKRAHTNMQHKLLKAEQKYQSEKDNFDTESNVYQQAKYKNEQQERNRTRLENSLTTTGPHDTHSGNIQLTISPQELEEYINQYFKEYRYSKINLNDKNNKVFINGKVNIVRDSLGNLGLVVPIKIDNRRMSFNGKVTQFNADLYFNIQLADSSSEKTMDISINAAHKLSKKPHYKLFATFQLIRIGKKANEKLKPALNKAIKDIQEKVDRILLKDNILNEIIKKLPEEVIIKPGIINVRPRVDSSNNQVFDIDFNADFQYQISNDRLKDVFTGYSIGDYHFEKIHNIEVSDGRVKVEIPLSGAITGSIVSAFDLIYCSEKQRFLFKNLNVTPQDNASLSVKFFSSGVNCLQSVLLEPIESYINNNLENVRLSAINDVQQRFHKEILGNLVIDTDSVIINSINCKNNITLDISLRSNNPSKNQANTISSDNNIEHHAKNQVSFFSVPAANQSVYQNLLPQKNTNIELSF